MKFFSILSLSLTSQMTLAHDSQTLHTHGATEFLLLVVCITLAVLFVAKK